MSYKRVSSYEFERTIKGQVIVAAFLEDGHLYLITEDVVWHLWFDADNQGSMTHRGEVYEVSEGLHNLLYSEIMEASYWVDGERTPNEWTLQCEACLDIKTRNGPFRFRWTNINWRAGDVDNYNPQLHILMRTGEDYDFHVDLLCDSYPDSELQQDVDTSR